jgi:hypothetical protein
MCGFGAAIWGGPTPRHGHITRVCRVGKAWCPRKAPSGELGCWEGEGRGHAATRKRAGMVGRMRGAAARVWRDRTRATVTWQTPVRAHDVSAKREHASEEVQLSVCLVNRTFSRSDGGRGGRHNWLTSTHHPKTCVLARTHLPRAAYGGGSMNMTASHPFDRPTVRNRHRGEWPGDLLERPRRSSREPHHEAKVDRCNRSVEIDGLVGAVRTDDATVSMRML